MKELSLSERDFGKGNCARKKKNECRARAVNNCSGAMYSGLKKKRKGWCEAREVSGLRRMGESTSLVSIPNRGLSGHFPLSVMLGEGSNLFATGPKPVPWWFQEHFSCVRWLAVL